MNGSKLEKATAEVRAELARVDSKSAGLASLSTLVLTVGTAGVVTLPLSVPAKALGWFGVALVAVSVGILVLAMRPVLGSPTAGPLAWGFHDLSEVMDRMSPDGDDRIESSREGTQLIILSKMVYRKWSRVRLAADLLLGGLAVGLAAGIASLIF
jgi:hypothetical protein